MLPKQAATLTKPWLMGVRRGFLSLIPSTVPDFDTALRTLVRLSNFVHRLELQVTRIRRGPNTDVSSETLFKAFSRDLARLYEALDYAESSCRHWKSIHDGTHHFAHQPGEQANAARQLNLYQTNFVDALSYHVPTKGRGSRGTRSAGIVEIFDKVMKHLFDAAKAIEKGDVTETAKQYWAGEVPIEFKIGNMTFVVVYAFRSALLFDEYVREARAAYGKLRRWGLDKQTWYGITFVMDTSAKLLTDDEKERYRHAGYDISAVGGDYSNRGNDIRTWSNVDQFQYTLIHELGHRYWFKHMSQSQRMRFIRSVWTKTHDKAVHPEWEKFVPREEAKDQLWKKWWPLKTERTRKFEQSAIESSAGLKGWYEMFQQGIQINPHEVDMYFMEVNNFLREDLPKFARFGRSVVKVHELFEFRAYRDLKLEFDQLCKRKWADLEALRDRIHPGATGHTPIDEAYRRELDAVVRENYRQCRSIMERIPEVVEPMLEAFLDAAYKDERTIEEMRKTKMMEPVSDYGKTNPDEAWAEAFMHLVGGKIMYVPQIRLMLDIIKGTKTAAQRVLDRFLAVDSAQMLRLAMPTMSPILVQKRKDQALINRRIREAARPRSRPDRTRGRGRPADRYDPYN